MNESLATHYLEDSIASLRAYKKLAEKALDRLDFRVAACIRRLCPARPDVCRPVRPLSNLVPA